MKTPLYDGAGMTVVEVVIALGVITVGLAALITAMPFSTSLIGESGRKTSATFLAQQRMEQVKNARWTFNPTTDTLGGAGANGTAATAQWPDEGYNSISGYPLFRREVRIADCSVVGCSGMPAASPLNTLRRVTVTVLFFPLAGTGQRGTSEESVRLVTLMTRRP